MMEEMKALLRQIASEAEELANRMEWHRPHRREGVATRALRDINEARDLLRQAGERLGFAGPDFPYPVVIPANGNGEAPAPNIPNDADSHFGVCPTCGSEGSYVNIGRQHYFLCETHKVFWHVGANLFSSWKEETEEDWQRNRELLSGFTEIDEYHPELVATGAATPVGTEGECEIPF
jgi:hypothetical protein